MDAAADQQRVKTVLRRAANVGVRPIADGEHLGLRDGTPREARGLGEPAPLRAAWRKLVNFDPA